MFRIILLRPILALLTWWAHRQNSHLYDQEHASVYGKKHAPDSLYETMAQKIIYALKRHIALNECIALDAGGGTGSFAERLLEDGARKVCLYDRSTEMLSIATSRLKVFGDRAVTWQANLEDRICLEDSSVNCILCVQVLHYIEDWDFIAAEFFRVLKDGGCVVVVTVHPAADTVFRGIGPYFRPEMRRAFLSSGGKLRPITYWHRPLEAMLAPFLSAGFMVADIEEPHLGAAQSRPWWNVAESLFQYFPPYVIFVFRKL
ncbi:MAG: class I SAM-dependent methyltransferase [Anaerolineae bacterium]|nr:class I SAM-dependent methyltransferase [Anaerolineae bacterium]